MLGYGSGGLEGVIRGCEAQYLGLGTHDLGESCTMSHKGSGDCSKVEGKLPAVPV